ncbi:peptidase M48-like protein [Pontibacter ummariensis]|uniref:Peptidase family M48 n=1 Tax=Pontibacter ummariensis TaxID=1610492 RepID=A0A239FT40_9BACT|nr:M48 family metalloprotease [Pontibacter ummariensis]PRY11936.1 peptidase M48-like protein [Pontibacter ummariensis]SNS60000.1 Peptidase family M48 [Pontibacter ummariensis]
MRKHIFTPAWLLALVAMLTLGSCESNDGVIFSTKDDISLGQQVSQEVDSTYRAQGKLLERNSSNANVQKAYQNLDRIVNRILNSGQVKYRQEFPWTVKLIKDDNTLNAFATPGGQIYVFTGLIKYLQDEDHFAGVLAHEIAHADKRHSVKQLQRDYGISLLLSVALGNNPSTLREIAAQLTGSLAGLKFSRDAEKEADETSVLYLGGTNYYACDGAAGFFIRLEQDSQQGTPPEFLSTHPSPDNRILNIEQKAQKQGCDTSSAPDTDFEQLKSALNL